MMSMLKKIVLFPISLFVAFLALMARWLLTLSSYVVAPLMLYIDVYKRQRMLSAILSFCRSVTALRTSNLHGCSWARPRMALPSTSISQTTRR